MKVTNIKSYNFLGFRIISTPSLQIATSTGVHSVSLDSLCVPNQMFAARNATTWSGSGWLHVRVSEQAAGVERGVHWSRTASPIKLSMSVKASQLRVVQSHCSFANIDSITAYNLEKTQRMGHARSLTSCSGRYRNHKTCAVCSCPLPHSALSHRINQHCEGAYLIYFSSGNGFSIEPKWQKKRKVQFCESYKKKNQFFETFFKRFNSWTSFVFKKKGSILRVMKNRRFNS